MATNAGRSAVIRVSPLAGRNEGSRNFLRALPAWIISAVTHALLLTLFLFTTFEPAAVTSATGGFTFVGLPSAAYTVRLVLPTGRVETTSNPPTFGPSSGAMVTGLLFGTAQVSAASAVRFSQAPSALTNQASAGRKRHTMKSPMPPALKPRITENDWDKGEF